MLRNAVSKAEIPLKEIRVLGVLVDVVAQVTMEQVFHNTSDSPIEAVFKFPLDGMSAVCYCAATIDGTTIVSEVKETEEAKASYDDAISEGKGAYLLEKEEGNVFTMNVGNLPPNQVVEIKIIFVTELLASGTCSVQFTLPTTLLRGQPDGYFPQNQNGAEKNLFRFEVQLSIEMPGTIEAIGLPNHPDLRAEISGCKAVFSSSNVELGRDFRVVIKMKEIKSHIWIESKPEGTEVDPYAVMITLRPEFNYKESASEVIFLIDRSGSMSGDRIQSARETLFTALKHLPETCSFNIYGFGNSLEELFTESQQCNLHSIYVARSAITKMDANLGGTDLYTPLQAILKKSNTSKLIFLLSDGGVHNPNEVRHLVESEIAEKDFRLFTFGIGLGCDLVLLEDLARLGEGTCTAIREINEEFEDKIINQVNAALQPAFNDITISWEGNSTKDIFLQAPIKLPPIFNHQLYTIYALVKDTSWTFEGLTLTAKGKAGEENFRFTKDSATYKLPDLEIHRLTARCLIREMEEAGPFKIAANVAKKEIIRVAKMYNLASQYTSFLGIENRKDIQTEATMRFVPVPSPPVTLVKYTPQRSSAIPATVTGAVSFRACEIKYRKNEFFLDVVEHQDVLISATGHVIRSMRKDNIHAACFLSGMPEIRIGLDEIIRRGDFKKGGDSLELHQCVRLRRFEEEGILTLIPPDGPFPLLEFVRQDEEAFIPLFTANATIERFTGQKIDYYIRVKANFQENIRGQVQVVIPVPSGVVNTSLSVGPTQGKILYRAEANQILWKGSMSGQAVVVIRASFSLQANQAPSENLPIIVNYEIPYATPKMVKVQYVKIIEKSGYQVQKFIRYFCKGQEEIRTTEIVRNEIL